MGRGRSPDGRWVAEIGSSESVEFGSDGTGWSGYYRGMRFVNAADGITHTLFATWTEAGIPSLVPTLVGWDADGRHAYVFEIAHACCCHHRDTGYVLERVDLDTGARFVLESDLSIPRISPAGDAIAFVPSHRDPNHVEVLELESGRVMASDAFDGLVSDMSWSPTGRRLALVLVTDGCANEPEMSTVLLIDRESGRTGEPWAPILEVVRQAKWLDERRIELVSEAGGTRLVEVGEY